MQTITLELVPPLVLHVIHHLHIGGMENGLVNLINHMSPEKYRHAIACVEDYSNFRARLERQGVAVYALERSKMGVWALRRKLYELCKILQPAIVHTRNMSGLDAVLPATLAGVQIRVHGEHGWDVGNLHGERLKPKLLRRLHAPLVTRYVTVSRDLADYLTNGIGVAPARISHICNGVDTDRFHPSEQQARREVLPGDFRDARLLVIGNVGRVQAVKDQMLLLHAFAALRAEQADFAARLRLAIIGDGPLLDALRALAESLGITPFVWLPGAADNIPEIMRAFDLFVLPSLNEGISNTILEALASGLPVIATNVGGNPELVAPGHTGELFPPRELPALVDALRGYLTDDDKRRRHGTAARAAALAEFSLSTMVARYTALYDELLVKKRAL